VQERSVKNKEKLSIGPGLNVSMKLLLLVSSYGIGAYM
jgi:hypothetical protein